MSAYEVTTVCYGMVRKWKSRNDAKVYFARCVRMSTCRDEKRRYKSILKMLSSDEEVCVDDG